MKLSYPPASFSLKRVCKTHNYYGLPIFFQKTLNIQDTPMMAMGSMAAAPAPKVQSFKHEIVFFLR